jgi:AmmeMemoRadiSam system protein A
MTVEPSVSTGPLDETTRRWLLGLARSTVRLALDGAGLVLPDPSGTPVDAAVPGAAFVTLRRDGDLLGCIGSIEAVRPLAEDVALHAYDAAFRDPRLPPVTDDDWHHMTTEISVLGPLEPVHVDGPDELARVIRPEVDGLLVSSTEGRGTFLPSVWHQVRDADEFLELLWRKAGLRAGRWPQDLVVERYQVDEFDDAD